MIDHNHIRRLGIFTRLHDKTFFVIRAIRAKTIFASGSNLRPNQRIIGDIGPFRLIPTFHVGQIGLDAFDVLRVVAANQATIHQDAI